MMTLTRTLAWLGNSWFYILDMLARTPVSVGLLTKPYREHVELRSTLIQESLGASTDLCVGVFRVQGLEDDGSIDRTWLDLDLLPVCFFLRLIIRVSLPILSTVIHHSIRVCTDQE